MKSETTVLILGILMVIVGLAFRIYVSRKRFYRRGSGGLQQYSSYSKAVSTSAFESVLKILGMLLLILGIFFCFVAWSNKRTTKQHNVNADTLATTLKE